jgi:hypothetical protein
MGITPWSVAPKQPRYDMLSVSLGISRASLFNYTGLDWLIVLLNSVTKDLRIKLVRLF